MKEIRSIKHSNQLFAKKFRDYPNQYTWNFKGANLHAYSWETKSAVEIQPKAVIVNLNALNAHTGLSSNMASSLSEIGVVMTGFDYPNFGKSESPFPGHIECVEKLTDISEEFLVHTVKKYPGVPVFLHGLSMGGLIAFQLGIRKPELIDGCIFTNPAFQDSPLNNPLLKKIMMFGGRVLPKFQTLKPIRSQSTKHCLTRYRTEDNLLYTGKVWTSTTWALLSHMRQKSIKEEFKKFTLPFLCIQGGSDKILNPFSVFEFEECCESVDKEVVIIPDMWHGMWFDDCESEAIEMTVNWIGNKIKANENNEKGEEKRE